MRDFLNKVVENRQEQIFKANCSHGMLFYLWHDAMASQLRFSLISDFHHNLPFGCPLKIIGNMDPIIEEFLASPNGILLDEVSEKENMLVDEEQPDDQNLSAKPLRVYLSRLKNFKSKGDKMTPSEQHLESDTWSEEDILIKTDGAIYTYYSPKRGETYETLVEFLHMPEFVSEAPIYQATVLWDQDVSAPQRVILLKKLHSSYRNVFNEKLLQRVKKQNEWLFTEVRPEELEHMLRIAKIYGFQITFVQID